MPYQKHFIYKVYGTDGASLLATYSTKRPSDGSGGYAKNGPSFDSQLNGFQGELVIDLAVDFDDYPAVLDFMNVVKVYAVTVDDTPSQTVTLIYSGFVSRIEPYLNDAGEGVRVTCLGLGSLTTFAYYKNGAAYEVTHSAEDPSAIAEAILDQVDTLHPGLLSYTPDSVQSVGTNVTVTFNDQKHADALKKTHELSGTDWWWHVGADGVYQLQQKPSSATHTFTIGLDVQSLTVTKDSEKVVNDVQVRGSGGNTDAFDATSISTYGTRSKVVSDTSLGDAQARQQRGNKEVADNKDSKAKTTLIINTNYEQGIESIKVGQTANVRNLRAGIVPDNALIASVRYDGDTVTVELGEQTDFGRELRKLIG